MEINKKGLIYRGIMTKKQVARLFKVNKEDNPSIHLCIFEGMYSWWYKLVWNDIPITIDL